MMTKTKIVLTMLMMIPMNNNISGCRSFDCCVEIQNDVVTRSPINFIGVDVVSFYHLTSPRRVGSLSVMQPSLCCRRIVASRLSCRRRRAAVASSRRVVSSCCLFALSLHVVSLHRRIASALRRSYRPPSSCHRRCAIIALPKSIKSTRRSCRSRRSAVASSLRVVSSLRRVASALIRSCRRRRATVVVPSCRHRVKSSHYSCCRHHAAIASSHRVVASCRLFVGRAVVVVPPSHRVESIALPIIVSAVDQAGS